MTGPDMGRGATVLRCFADFLAARPALPAATSVDVTWSVVCRAWTVRIHLFDVAARDLQAWAMSLDDAVTTTEPAPGWGTRIDVRGTVHGHPVRVWSYLGDAPAGGAR